MTDKQKELLEWEIDRLTVLVKQYASEGRAHMSMKTYNKKRDISRILSGEENIFHFVRTLSRDKRKYYIDLLNLRKRNKRVI